MYSCYTKHMTVGMLAAVTYGTPLQPDNNLVSPLVTDAEGAAPVEIQRSIRSAHGQYLDKTEIYLEKIGAALLF